MLWDSGHAPRENLEMIDAIWCVLMYYLIRLSLKKVSLFIIKNIDSSYTHLATLLLWATLPEKFKKKHGLYLMRFYHIWHKHSIGHLLRTSGDFYRPPIPKV